MQQTYQAIRIDPAETNPMPNISPTISAAYEDINATFVGRNLDSSQVIDVLAFAIAAVIKQYPPDNTADIMARLNQTLVAILSGEYEPPPPIQLVRREGMK
jgi:hypothetical protein